VAHTPLFANDPTVTATTSLINQISQQIGSQVSIFPLGSSSGGFTYKYDPALGSFSRTTQTFGPAFAERAVTAGKGRFSFGMNYRHASYDTLDGKELENGDIKFDLFHQKLSPPSFVEGDVIQASLRMKLTSDTTVFGVNYGITDRLDVGLAVPVVHVALDLTYNATILDFATHTVSPTTHLFANGTKTQDSNSSGSASGIGDVVVRGKYRFGPESAGLAAGLDLRLPSGDEKNFLGSGSTQTKLFFIGSGVTGKASPHVNVGYTFSSGDVADEFNYVGGAEFGVAPKVTVIVDLVGRTLRNSLRLNDSSIPHEFQQGPSAPIERTTLPTIALTPGNLTTVLGTAGAKFNPWRNLLVSAHLLFPLNDAGLHSSVTPVIGVEYSF
jgi:Putative MetA-pathway of phenol degradation